MAIIRTYEECNVVTDAGSAIELSRNNIKFKSLTNCAAMIQIALILVMRFAAAEPP